MTCPDITYGFAVVIRIGNRFIPVRYEMDARGTTPDEIWIFGRPTMSHEYRTFLEIQKQVRITDKTMIHQIPATDPASPIVREVLEQRIEETP